MGIRWAPSNIPRHYFRTVLLRLKAGHGILTNVYYIPRQHHYRVSLDKILQSCKVQVKSVIIIQCQFPQLASRGSVWRSCHYTFYHFLNVAYSPIPLRVDITRTCIGSSAPTTPGRRYTIGYVGYRPIGSPGLIRCGSRSRFVGHHLGDIEYLSPNFLSIWLLSLDMAEDCKARWSFPVPTLTHRGLKARVEL